MEDCKCNEILNDNAYISSTMAQINEISIFYYFNFILHVFMPISRYYAINKQKVKIQILLG